MGYVEQLDPELAAVLQTLPPEGFLNWQDLPGTRAVTEQMLAAMTADLPDSPNVTKEDRAAPGSAGAPDVPVRVYRPAHAAGPLPCLFWIHGGGMVLGNVAMDDHNVQHVVEAVGCTAVSVEYRLAPEHPFPAPLEDCHAALRWLAEHAGAVGLDRSRIAVGGYSSGGNLSAALALLARDRGEVPLAFQLLLYPALEDRHIVPSPRGDTVPRVVNWEDKLRCFRAYLGTDPGGAGVSPYAAPARATDLAGLPPAYLMVGTQDVLVDEGITYAHRLIAAEVPTELHVYPGAYHGCELLAPTAALSQRMNADWRGALQRALFG